MSKHTLGPWDIIDQYIIAADESVICQWESYTDKANARLIAAAPDLLAALLAIANKAHPRADYLNGEATHYIGPKDLVDAARAAIAKAEGVS